MTKLLLVATKNPAKFSDLKKGLSDLPFNLVSLKDMGISEDIEETGKTFEENARRKALFYAKKLRLPTIADDGGIEIEVLGGEPGIKTRRWIDDKESTDEQLIKYTLIRMRKYKGLNRRAQLRVVICLALPSGKTYLTQGMIEGVIADKPYKTYKKGFPFDALLYLPDKRKYYYQLKYEDQKSINHRITALQKLKSIIKRVVK